MPSLKTLAKHRGQTEQALKQAAVEAVQQGVPVTQVARQAGVTRATIYSWMKGAK